MKVLIFGGCNNRKILSHISPILESSLVDTVYLVRNDILNIDNPKLLQYPVPNFLRKFVFTREIYRFLTGLYIMFTQKVDLIIAVHFLMHGVYTYLLSKIFQKKTVYMIIEEPSLYNGWKFFINALKQSIAVGVMGKSSLRYLVDKGLQAENIFIPPCEFYMPGISPKPFKDKKYDLIYIGNFVDVKDLPLWVEIVKHVKDSHPNIKAVMLGDGERYRFIKKLIEDKNLSNNITLVGRQKDIYSYINDSRILLMSSKSEGLPVVMTECMALGVPAVVPNVGDVSDLVKNGENGYIVRSREPDEYSLIISALLSDENSYEKLSLNALNTMKEWSKTSSLDSIVDMWNLFLKRV